MKRNISKLLSGFIILTIVFFSGAVRAENLSVTASVVPATIDINGYTQPNSLVTIENFGSALGTTVADASGYFSQTYSDVDEGIYEITIVAEDSFGTDTEPRTFTFAILDRQVQEIHNVILPPTVYPGNPSPAVGSPIVVQLYGKPNQTAYIVLNDGSSSTTYSSSTNSSGQATFSIDSSGFTEGDYDVYGYFEVAYPSASFTFTLLPAPSATPTPTPTETPTPTPTPAIQPTTIPGQGASATPGPGPTAEATTQPGEIEPTGKPDGCTFPIPKLCTYDDDGSNIIEIDGELEEFITDFINAFRSDDERFDLNNDGIVDLFDLSLLLRYVSYPPGIVSLFHTETTNEIGICTEGEIASGERDSASAYVSFLVLLLIFIFMLGRLGGQISFFARVLYVLLFTGGFFLLLGMANYNRYAQNFARWQQRQSSTSIQQLKAGDRVTYEVLLSSRQQTLNTFEVHLGFDPNSARVVDLNASKSIAPIITQLGFSNQCGRILVIGGLPQAVPLFSDKHFVEVTLEVLKENPDISVKVAPGTKAYSSQSKDKKDVFTPDVKIKRVNK